MILSTTPQDVHPVRRGVGEKQREKAKIKMHEAHKVPYILQGSFSELNAATFFYLVYLFINNFPHNKIENDFKRGQ